MRGRRAGRRGYRGTRDTCDQERAARVRAMRCGVRRQAPGGLELPRRVGERAVAHVRRARDRWSTPLEACVQQIQLAAEYRDGCLRERLVVHRLDRRHHAHRVAGRKKSTAIVLS